MATWEDVRRIALALPDTAEGSSREGNRVWDIHGKGFVWERPLRKGDRTALGDAAPDGPILCAYVPDLEAKDSWIGENPDVFFTTPHFNGFRAVLVQLDPVSPAVLEELLVEAWFSRAPKRVAKAYLEERRTQSG